MQGINPVERVRENKVFEFMMSNCVSEVQDGKVKYFKEYTQRGQGVIFRKEISHEAFVDADSFKYSKDVQIHETQSLVTTLADMVNGNHIDFIAFYNQMRQEHRYLQGQIANLFVRWLVEAANPNDKYGFDERNELVKIAGTVLKTRF